MFIYLKYLFIYLYLFKNSFICENNYDRVPLLKLILSFNCIVKYTYHHPPLTSPTQVAHIFRSTSVVLKLAKLAAKRIESLCSAWMQ